MSKSILTEDIKRFKKIISYNPSFGLISEGITSSMFKTLISRLTKSVVKNSLDNFAAKVLKKVPGDIILVTKGASGDVLTSDGKKFLDNILSKEGGVLYNNLDNTQKLGLFRIAKEAQEMINTSKLVKNTQKIDNKVGQLSKGSQHLTSFETKHLLKNCFHSNYCDTKTILSDFMRKIGNIAKLPKFEPSSVKILDQSNVAGRQVINVQLPNGDKILMYKSSGSNLQTTGKKSGEWFIIPGFAENGWFFKTHETISFTKGGNKYLTEFAQHLEKNGVNGFSNGSTPAVGIKSTVNTATNLLNGQRISNRWHGWKPENINFSKFTNKMSFDDLNKSIATAIKTGNWNLVPRAGFEKFGIPNFREFLQKNISKVNDLDPSIGRWSVNFK